MLLEHTALGICCWRTPRWKNDDGEHHTGNRYAAGAHCAGKMLPQMDTSRMNILICIIIVNCK